MIQATSIFPLFFRQIMQSHSLSLSLTHCATVFCLTFHTIKKIFPSQAEKWEPKSKKKRHSIHELLFLLLLVQSQNMFCRVLSSLYCTNLDPIKLRNSSSSLAPFLQFRFRKEENFSCRPLWMAFNSRNLFTVRFSFLSCWFTGSLEYYFKQEPKILRSGEWERQLSWCLFIFFILLLVSSFWWYFLQSQQFRLVYSRFSFSLCCFLFPFLLLMASCWEL